MTTGEIPPRTPRSGTAPSANTILAGSTVPLNVFDTVFCDSLEALETAYGHGLPRSATILTRAPALLVCEDLPAVDLDTRRCASDAALEEFYFTGTAFHERCLRELERHEETTPLSRLIVGEIWIWQRHVLCAMLLTDADFTQPRLVIEADLENDQLTQLIRFPWSELLSTNSECETFRIAIKAPHLRTASLQAETVWRRLAVRGPGHFVWRLAERISQMMPVWASRGSFWSVKENELVRDCALQFALHGYRIGRLDLTAARRTHDEAHPIAARVLDMLKQPLCERLDRLVPDLAFEPLMEKLAHHLSVQLHAHDDAHQWLTARPELFAKRNTVIATNFPAGGEMVALARQAARRGAVFVGTQHGVTREILDRPQNHPICETAIAPYYLTMTRKAAEFAQNNAIGLSGRSTLSVGLTRDYRHSRSRLPLRRTPHTAPILYAQTLFSAGKHFPGMSYRNDMENFRRERRLLQEVFDGLGHRVLFKPYPNFCYADPEPIAAIANAIANIQVDMSRVDLRFLLAEHRVVIASCATSTVGWCIGSGLPLVYFDPVSYALRLKPEVREIFQSTAFYFDQRSASFYADLKTFLSQPIEKIEAVWAEKKAEREDLLEDYFGTLPETGSKAYHWLSAQISQPCPRPPKVAPNAQGG